MNVRQSGAHRETIEREHRTAATWTRENQVLLRKSRPQDFNPVKYHMYGPPNNARMFVKNEEHEQQTMSVLSQGMGAPPRALYEQANGRVKSRARTPIRTHPNQMQVQQQMQSPYSASSRRPQRVQTPVRSVPGSRASSKNSPMHQFDNGEMQIFAEPEAPAQRLPTPKQLSTVRPKEEGIFERQKTPASASAPTEHQETNKERADRMQKQLLDEFYPGKGPNQHGHRLLAEYDATSEAAGLGAGPTHRYYYRYLAATKPPPDKDFDWSAVPKDNSYKSKGVAVPIASGMGYGTRHDFYSRYLCGTRVSDTPEHTKPLNLYLLNKI